MSDEFKVFLNVNSELNKTCMNKFILFFADWANKKLGLHVMCDYFKHQTTPIIFIKNKEDIYYDHLTNFRLINELKEFNKIHNISASFYDNICHLLFERINKVITFPLYNFNKKNSYLF